MSIRSNSIKPSELLCPRASRFVPRLRWDNQDSVVSTIGLVSYQPRVKSPELFPSLLHRVSESDLPHCGEP